MSCRLFNLQNPATYMIGNNVLLFLSGPHLTCNFKPLLYSSVYITFYIKINFHILLIIILIKPLIKVLVIL